MEVSKEQLDIWISEKKKKKIRIEDMDLELISTEMVNDTMWMNEMHQGEYTGWKEEIV